MAAETNEISKLKPGSISPFLLGKWEGKSQAKTETVFIIVLLCPPSPSTCQDLLNVWMPQLTPRPWPTQAPSHPSELLGKT